MIMAKDNDLLKAEMIDSINSGGAWFTTRENNYLKIGCTDNDDRLCARVCILKGGSLQDGSSDPAGASGTQEPVLTGKAYTFGRDWFDISFHGRLTDIYVDPDTLESWDIRFDPDKGTYQDPGSERSASGALMTFCSLADSEALAGVEGAYKIDGAGFADELMPSEERMGRRKGIFSLVDIGPLKKSGNQHD